MTTFPYLLDEQSNSPLQPLLHSNMVGLELPKNNLLGALFFDVLQQTLIQSWLIRLFLLLYIFDFSYSLIFVNFVFPFKPEIDFSRIYFIFLGVDSSSSLYRAVSVFFLSFMLSFCTTVSYALLRSLSWFGTGLVLSSTFRLFLLSWYFLKCRRFRNRFATSIFFSYFISSFGFWYFKLSCVHIESLFNSWPESLSHRRCRLVPASRRCKCVMSYKIYNQFCSLFLLKEWVDCR